MDRDELKFIATCSARYHRRRAAFLERVGAIMSVTTLSGGAGAFLAVVGEKTIFAQIAAILVVIVGIVQMEFHTESCAEKHRQWLREWHDMLVDIERNAKPNAKTINEWVSRKYAIESECVGEMRALANDSWNRTLNEMQRPGKPYKLTWWHRLWMQIVPFDNADYRDAPEAAPPP